MPAELLACPYGPGADTAMTSPALEAPPLPVNGYETAPRPKCYVCTAPAPPRHSKKGPPPEVHDPCRRWNGYWTVAREALEEIAFPDAPEGDAARAMIAAELRAAANRLMAGQWERDTAGRFAGRR